MRTEHLQRYSEFRPTAFDSRGLSLPDRQDWYLAPVSRTRDSGTRAESNFAACLEALGGESATVEVHRFGHWGPGWFEVILIDPADTARVQTAIEIAGALADYPVLDDSDHSERESEAAWEAWQNWGAQAAAKELIAAFDLAHDTAWFLKHDVDQDALLTFLQEWDHTGYEYNGDSPSYDHDAMIDRRSREENARGLLAAFLWAARKGGR